MFTNQLARVARVVRGTGRDFVTSDIHGSFDLLYQGLAELNFDPSQDRLFIVGDLIDKGENSEEARNVLESHWAFCLRGNHENLCLEMYDGSVLDKEKLEFNIEKNGMAWWAGLTQPERLDFLHQFAALPVAMEVDTEQGAVGLVHAEVPLGMPWPVFMLALQSGDPRVTMHALWSRDRVNRGIVTPVPGIAKVFCGHTPHVRATAYGNVCVLDTLAYGHKFQGGKLTIANILCSPEDLAHPIERGALLLYPEPRLRNKKTLNGAAFLKTLNHR